jgi:hypothetical protein
LSSPSSNHFAQGICQSSTLVNGLIHASSLRAISPQNASGSWIERLYNRSYSAASDKSA